MAFSLSRSLFVFEGSVSVIWGAMKKDLVVTFQCIFHKRRDYKYRPLALVFTYMENPKNLR
jgi:hypothetical protein